MEQILNFPTQLLNFLTQNMDILFLVLVFACTVILVMFFMNFFVGAVGLRRRTSSAIESARGARATDTDIPDDVHPILRMRSGSLTNSSRNLLAPRSDAEKAQIRKFLEHAGFYSAAAPFFYQLSRIITAILLGMVALFATGKLFPNLPAFALIFVAMLMTLLGYLLPKTIVSMRRDGLRNEHRHGFPDFLDLLVICTEAGVGIDAAIDRVSKDIYLSHPSLSRNLYLMTLELRAGRSLRDALFNLADRLGIDEAKSFATLLQQSEELGSSLVDSLRVYSDEMRAKRLARAEEKAHALPAKLVFPLGFCVFPVILAVTMMPVVIRIYKGLGIT